MTPLAKMECIRQSRITNSRGGWGGGGYSHIRAKWGRAASQGMFFGIFVLNRVSNLSFFVLIRVLIYQFLSYTGLNVLNRVSKIGILS